jgi:hypothetical protein
MRSIRCRTRLAPLLPIVCALVLAGCGGSSGSSAPSSTTSHGSTSGGGTSSPPPVLIYLAVFGLPGGGTIEALATQGQGQGYVNVQLTVVAQQGAPSVRLVSIEATTLNSSGTQVGPITTTSLTGAPVSGVIGYSATVEVPTATPGIFTIEAWVTDANGNKSGKDTTTIDVLPYSAYATVVTETGPDPAPLIQSNGTLYWAESGENALKSAPTSGGAAKVLATRMLNPASVVFPTSGVVWLDDRDGTVASCTSSSITRVLKQTATNGFSSVLASGPSCSGGASQIALIGATVYWVSSTASPGTWVINAVPLSGAAASTVRTTTTPVVALTANAGTLYWMENPFPSGTATILALTPGGAVTTVASGFTADANTFAVDSTSVYYATPNVPATTPPTETLWAQPLSGGAALALATSISTPVKLLSTLPLGGSSIVWVDQAAVNSVPATGGAVTQVGSVSGTPIDLLYDGTNVRWSEITANMGQYGETGMIESVPLSGGTVTTLYQGGDAPRELAEDPQGRLNWTEGGPVGVTEGFAQIARIGTTGSAEPVVAGINAAYLLSSYSAESSRGYFQYPFSLPIVATSNSLLIADQWRIKSLPLTGGQPTTVAAPDGGVIGALATDGTSVYWDDSTSSVSKAPVGGGAITALVPPSLLGGYAGPGGPIVLAPNGTLYWAIYDLCTPSACGSVSIANAPSSVPSTSLNIIVSNDGFGFVPDLAVNDTALFFSEQENPGLGMAGTLRWSAPLPFTLYPTLVALDGSSLFWIAGGPGAGTNPGPTIYQSTINIQGSPTVPLLLESQNGDWLALALDSNYVYFVDGQLIRKTPRILDLTTSPWP